MKRNSKNTTPNGLPLVASAVVVPAAGNLDKAVPVMAAIVVPVVMAGAPLVLKATITTTTLNSKKQFLPVRNS
jgi:hypothetical protein